MSAKSAPDLPEYIIILHTNINHKYSYVYQFLLIITISQDFRTGYFEKHKL